jgi:hypothetical protein
LKTKGLDSQAEQVNGWIKEALQPQLVQNNPEKRMAVLLAGLGKEDASSKQLVYLGTVSRVLPETLAATDLVDVNTLQRQDVLEMVKKAFDEPLASPGRAGRPVTRQYSIVKRVIVFKEDHEDGDTHFHIAVLLKQPRSFTVAKRTLRERDHLPSHWSCSHTQMWSAVRYGAVPSLTKPDVDSSPATYSDDGSEVDVFAEAQRPWNADVWKFRHEDVEKQKAAGVNVKRARFCKLDLTALVLAKNLTTKAAVLSYAQDHGTEDMQNFVHQNQKRLREYLDEAKEWGEARVTAIAERETDWALVCRTSEQECPHGQSCQYAAMAKQFFEANANSLSRVELAAALRAIIVGGPSKTTRVPMIVGPTNCGKSTLLKALYLVFGKKNVHIKPAPGSSFALASIVKNKRFLFWDDVRPVELGQAAVPVATFLSMFEGEPFEVQVSQSFNDGNPDFEWRRGAVMTAKEVGLWEPWGAVDAEDVRHMMSRLHIFTCRAKVTKLKDVCLCGICCCRWIVAGAAEYDAQQLREQMPQPGPLPPPQDGSDQIGQKVVGMAALIGKAAIPGAIASMRYHRRAGPRGDEH